MENLESSNPVDICAVALLTVKNQRNRCLSKIFTSSNLLCRKILYALDSITQRERESHIDVYHVTKAFQRSLKETARDFQLLRTCDVL